MTPVITPAGSRGTWKSRFNPSAAPRNSATSVDIEISSAWTHIAQERRRVERPVERLALDHLELRARGDPALSQEAEHLRVGVRDTHEGRPLARLEVVERTRLVVGDRQLSARDRVAVRVEGRVAELGGDQLLEALGGDGLGPLSFGMHLVPALAPVPHEE